MPLLRDLSLLATYLPTVNAFLRDAESGAGRKGDSIEVAGEEFLEQWFAALPALKTLGYTRWFPRR